MENKQSVVKNNYWLCQEWNIICLQIQINFGTSIRQKLNTEIEIVNFEQMEIT